MRGKGFPELRSRGKGDQMVKVQVVSPSQLKKDQQSAYEQLRQVEPAIPERERYGKFEH